MLRRALMAVIPAIPAAFMPRKRPQMPENAFAEAYNEWIRLLVAAPAGTVSAPAVLQWKRVRRAWRELERDVG